MASSHPIPVINAPAITQLLSEAYANRKGSLVYAGEVLPEQAYAFLQVNDGALIDVRSVPEWQLTGLPDLSAAEGMLATISWKQYPDFSLNAQFAEQLAAVVTNKDMPLFFLCRSGGRSLDAAVTMSAAGYMYCFNVTDGFEGDPDAQGHRGQAKGWKAKQLPWKQG